MAKEWSEWVEWDSLRATRKAYVKARHRHLRALRTGDQRETWEALAYLAHWAGIYRLALRFTLA